MAKSKGLRNAPSKTGKPSGNHRANNPPKSTGGGKGKSTGGSKRK